MVADRGRMATQESGKAEAARIEAEEELDHREQNEADRHHEQQATWNGKGRMIRRRDHAAVQEQHQHGQNAQMARPEEVDAAPAEEGDGGDEKCGSDPAPSNGGVEDTAVDETIPEEEGMMDHQGRKAKDEQIPPGSDLA